VMRRLALHWVCVFALVALPVGEQPNAGATGLVAQAGATGYGVGLDGLIVFDTGTGETVQVVPRPRFTIGITIDSDGHVFTAAFGNVQGFRPVQ
jgi:hypothetical protein